MSAGLDLDPDEKILVSTPQGLGSATVVHSETDDPPHRRSALCGDRSAFRAEARRVPETATHCQNCRNVVADLEAIEADRSGGLQTDGGLESAPPIDRPVTRPAAALDLGAVGLAEEPTVHQFSTAELAVGVGATFLVGAVIGAGLSGGR